MYEELINKQKNIAVVGLGYVGLPLALLFSKKYNVIGFDVNDEKISLYKQGIDITGELPENSLINSNIYFTSNSEDIKKASFIVVAVPTPINDEDNPDFRYVISASETVGLNLNKGSIVVYESTVYEMILGSPVNKSVPAIFLIIQKLLSRISFSERGDNISRF